MIATGEPSPRASLHIGGKRRYMMMFRANRLGLAKRVELWGHDANEALELALADHSQRTVDVWEDGDFLCSVSRPKNPRDENEVIGQLE